MVGDLAIRFLVGGAIVSVFAVAGDLFKPKTFAGIFGAAPSVALASLALAYGKQGEVYAGLKARSMVAGAVADVIANRFSADRQRRSGEPFVESDAGRRAGATG
jgi:Protein of unknown function (DUF3147)